MSVPSPGRWDGRRRTDERSNRPSQMGSHGADEGIDGGSGTDDQHVGTRMKDHRPVIHAGVCTETPSHQLTVGREKSCAKETSAPGERLHAAEPGSIVDIRESSANLCNNCPTISEIRQLGNRRSRHRWAAVRAAETVVAHAEVGFTCARPSVSSPTRRRGASSRRRRLPSHTSRVMAGSKRRAPESATDPSTFS